MERTDPQVCLLSSRTSDLAGSRIRDPVSVPSRTSACSAEAVGCPCGVMPPSVNFRSRARIVLIAKVYIHWGAGSQGGTAHPGSRAMTTTAGSSEQSALCLRLMQLFPA